MIFVKCVSYQRISVCQSLSSATKEEALFEESQAGSSEPAASGKMKEMTGFPVTLLLLFVSLKYFNQHERGCCPVRAGQFEKSVLRPPNRITTNKVAFVSCVKNQLYGR